MRPAISYFVHASTHLRTKIAVLAGLLAIVASGLTAAAQAPPVLLPWTINTLAGTGSNGLVNGPALSAQLSTDVRAVAVDGQGNVFFVDGGNNEIREINAATGMVTTVAGGGTICAAAIDEAGDGCLAATQTKLSGPRGLSVDKAGNIYIAGYTDEVVHEINAQTGIMTRIAGVVTDAKHYGTKSYSGDGGLATNAALDQPRGVRVDNNGNIWICDTSNNVVRKIDAKTGIITTVVGADTNGTSPATAGYAGDGSAANTSSVQLNVPTDIVFDSQNNAYIADFSNKVIREVNAATNTIGTIVGTYYASPTTAPATAPWGSTPGPVPATTLLGSVTKLAIDAANNIYFSDSGEGIVYFYDAVAKTITPIAGEYGFAGTTTGFTVCSEASDLLGDGCPATQALFYQGSSALGIAIDGQNNLYITDPNDARIRVVTTNANFPAQAAGQPATQTVEAHFSKNDSPKPSNGFIAASTAGDFSISGTPACTTNSDATTNCTLQVAFNPVAPGSRTSPLAITGALSNQSFGLSGVGDAALVSFDPGTISTLGSGLASSSGAAMDASGNLYIADTGNNRVIQINATTLAQTVFAGTGTAGYGGDGAAATSATLKAPAAVTVGSNGTVYIADTGNNTVRAVIDGVISTYAGGANAVCSVSVDAQGDGCPATQATLKAPAGLTTTANGDLFIADTGNNTIRRVDFSTGAINLHAGAVSGISCASSTDNFGDGCPLISASTAFSAPAGLASDASGDIFAVDTGDNLVRKLSAGTGLVTAVAGNGQAVFTGDGGPATSASLNGPMAVAVDGAGDLYIADTGNAVVRVVSASGTISSLAGEGGVAGSTGGTGAASQLLLKAPSGLAIDALGNLFIVDTGNSRVVEDNRNRGLLSFGNSNLGDTTQEQTATISNLGNASMTFANSPFYAASGATDMFLLDTAATTACSGNGAVGAGASCTLAAAFDPTAQGALADTLTIASNAVNQAATNLQLTGTGVYLTPTKVTLVLTSPSSGSIQYGQSATFTASVAPTTGSGTPAGTVTFSVDGSQQPAMTLGTNDTVTLVLSLAVGKHTIGANYSGDDTFAPSNSTLSAPVSQAATTTSLTISPTTQIQLQPVSFTAQVTSSTTGVPTGSVNFMSGATLLGSGQLSPQGQATFQTSSLAIAGYSVTAVYSGDPNYSTSTSSVVTLTVNPIPPGIVVSASQTTLSVPQGGSVQTVLTITPQGGLTGTVTLSCSGLPANANCTFYPTTLNLGGNPTSVPTCTVTGSTQACTTLTIATNVPPAALQASATPAGRGAGLLAAALFPACLFGIGGLFARRRRNLHWMTVLAVVALGGFMVLSGCTSNITQTAASATPTGTSTITVTLTGQNNVTQTQTLTFTVVAATPTTAQADRPSSLLPTLPQAIGFSALM